MDLGLRHVTRSPPSTWSFFTGRNTETHFWTNGRFLVHFLVDEYRTVQNHLTFIPVHHYIYYYILSVYLMTFHSSHYCFGCGYSKKGAPEIYNVS